MLKERVLVVNFMINFKYVIILALYLKRYGNIQNIRMHLVKNQGNERRFRFFFCI